MTETTRASYAESALTRGQPTSPSTDLITVLLGTWMMIGLFLDGYAHTNLIDELESFLTPWHAVFYSGFVATAGWISWTVYKRIEDAGSLRRAIPPGYGLSILGIGVFAVGGVGDGIWHTLWGIEAGIDALLSPTHLLLFLGILLILTTPLRALRSVDPARETGRVGRLALTLSMCLATALLAFFFFYLWAPGHGVWAEQPFIGSTGEGEFVVTLGMGGIMLSNLILLAPVAFFLKRWSPPLGLVTLSWGVVNFLTAAAFDLDLGLAVAVGLAGGIVADIVGRVARAGPDNRAGSIMVLTLAPLAAWSTYFLLISSWGTLQWPPEVWGGAITFTVLAGAGLATLSLSATGKGPDEPPPNRD